MNSKKLNFSDLILKVREPIKLLFTITVTFLGLILALGLRFDFQPDQIFVPELAVFPGLILVLLRLLTYSRFDLHGGYWRHSSTRDLKNIVIAHTICTTMFAAIALMIRLPGFPRSVLLIEYFVSIIFAGGSRFITRLICEEMLANAGRSESGDSKQVLILGAGNSGHLFLKTLLSYKRLGLAPIGVLDDDDRLQGFSVHGINVIGKLSDLPKVLSTNPGVRAVVLAIPTLSKARISELEKICAPFKASLKRVQAFEDIALRDAMSVDEPSSIEVILERPISSENDERVLAQLKGKKVLVTGGGGSIGSELVRQIIGFSPRKISILDSSEYNLFRAELEFTKVQQEVEKRFIIGNICDRSRLENIFDQERPDFVFHAAAYKHVPIMEGNCSEAFKNNILGTWNVLDCSSRFEVSRFVLISTDKAIDPSSVMGCSKRIAEWVVQAYSGGYLGKSKGPDSTLNTAIVRFGNVINSNGSVVPLFREQILSGGPVTVTHPEIERYFMSIQEAVRLVLTAGTLGAKGEVYVLDMGKKLKIVDVANKMLSLYGRPDIPIVFTGLRPGEKLTEDLLGKHEKITATNFSKVSRVDSPKVPLEIGKMIKEIEAKLSELTDAEVGQILHKLVSEGVRMMSAKETSSGSVRANA